MECHTLSKTMINYGKSIIKNCKFILGLSGSISENTEKILLDELELPILIEYSIEEAITDGLISNYQITVHKVPLDDKKIIGKSKKGVGITEKRKYDNYTFVIEKLKEEKKDFMFLALSRNRILQSSIAKIDYTKKLLKTFIDKRVLVFTGLQKSSESLNIPFYHSKSRDEQSYLDFNSEVINHLGLANIGSIGITFSNLDSIILTSFTWNEEKILQTLCRCMVLDYENKIADLHIICSTEIAELKKLKSILSNFNPSKINYI